MAKYHNIHCEICDKFVNIPKTRSVCSTKCSRIKTDRNQKIHIKKHRLKKKLLILSLENNKPLNT